MYAVTSAAVAKNLLATPGNLSLVLAEMAGRPEVMEDPRKLVEGEG
jgi:hypothetical protein